MSKYAIWNKTDNIYTPVGEVLTPEQWIGRYGWIGNPAAVPIVAAGLVNGAFCGELSQMKALYEGQGAVFEEGLSDEELRGKTAEFKARLGWNIKT